MSFTEEELRRYARHLVLPEVGTEGQKKLKTAGVLIVGVGGLGSPLAVYLAAAGVGRIGLVDSDSVDISNLQRQMLYSTEDVGRSKIVSARKRLEGINPHLTIETFDTRLTSENALEIFSGFDIIADGSDNFPTRYLVNDACIMLGKPDVYASVFRFEGQVSVFGTENGPCYRCLYPEPPAPGLVQSCAEGGVLGVLPGIVGSLQANEVLKLILGIGEPLIGRVLLFDALKMQFHEMRVQKNPTCPMCGDKRTITELIDYEAFCAGEMNVKSAAKSANKWEIGAEDLKKRLGKKEPLFLLDVREPAEYKIAHLGGHLIPLNQLPGRLNEIDGSRDIVVYCHHGIRSQMAVDFLRQSGFKNVKNLTGGIDEWSRVVDHAVPRY